MQGTPSQKLEPVFPSEVSIGAVFKLESRDSAPHLFIKVLGNHPSGNIRALSCDVAKECILDTKNQIVEREGFVSFSFTRATLATSREYAAYIKHRRAALLEASMSTVRLYGRFEQLVGIDHPIQDH